MPNRPPFEMQREGKSDTIRLVSRQVKSIFPGQPVHLAVEDFKPVELMSRFGVLVTEHVLAGPPQRGLLDKVPDGVH
jgi:hypothetical protein